MLWKKCGLAAKPSKANNLERGTEQARAHQGAQDTDLTRLKAPAQATRRALLVGGGLLLGPHALCLLGIGGGVGLGGFAVHRWCSHSTENLGIILPKLPEVPAQRIEFSAARAALAKERLWQAEPRLQQVLDKKAEESPGEEIKVVFLEGLPNRELVVVICKDGALCPCSKPESFSLGHRNKLAQEEDFPGQRAIIEALYTGR